MIIPNAIQEYRMFKLNLNSPISFLPPIEIDALHDSFRSRRPIDIIAQTNPILIIDEPQSVEGKQTRERLKEFNPLFTLRYSATHRSDSIYNMVYRLDAMEAYNKKLVKKIAVKGITESGSTATDGYVYLEGINLSKADPTATIQFDYMGKSGLRKISRKVGIGYNLYDNSGEVTKLEEYKNGFVVKAIDGRDDSLEFLNGVKLYAGDVVGKVSEEQLRRIQIRETILSHIERERQLFYKGIKVLSLFFIDEVAHYKQYDAAGQPHAIVCGTIMSPSPDKMVVGEVLMKKSRANLEANPKAAFMIAAGMNAYEIDVANPVRIADGPALDEMNKALAAIHLKAAAMWMFDVTAVYEQGANPNAGTKIA